MMNKGLELIEAHWLFNCPPEKLEVVIHPQSVIHSMVRYRDGSVLAQLAILICVRRLLIVWACPNVSIPVWASWISALYPR